MNAAVRAKGRALRVGIVSETYPPDVNGCAKTIGRYVEGLLARGHDVQLVRPGQGGRDRPGRNGRFELVTAIGMPIPCYTFQRFGLPAPRALARLWTARPADVVYVATEGPLGASAMAVAAALGIPVLTSFHTDWNRYSEKYHLGWLRPAIERYLRAFHNRAVRTLVPTEQQARSLARAGYERPDVLGRGIDPESYSPAWRSEELRLSWGVGASDLAVLYVGRIAGEKNLRLAVRAFQAMRREAPSARFILVGDGPLRRDLEAEHPEMVFCGVQRGRELARRYASADVFLFPSMTETFGNVTLEAMASGLAVVAYDYAAAGTHLAHGESGMLAGFGCEEEFIECARALAADPGLARRLGRRARRAALEVSWDRICDRLEAFLLESTR